MGQLYGAEKKVTYAKVICDSVSPAGDRLTTVEGELHRFCLSELNTHRMFSRNSASSRAIPVMKQIKRIQEDLAYPISWPVEKPGMQGGEEMSEEDVRECRRDWKAASDYAIAMVRNLTRNTLNHPLHKSVANRLLEPFMWHKVIISSTTEGWENFFNLRCSPLAQPEIRVFAEDVQEAYDRSDPTPRTYDEWHLPYITYGDRTWLRENVFGARHDVDIFIDGLKRLSVARSARVSTLNHDGVRDPAEDLAFFDRLASARPMHASPMEHVATPHGENYHHLGNFSGWDQWRHEVERW